MNPQVKSCGCKIVDGVLQKCGQPDCFFNVVSGAKLKTK